MSNVVNTHGQWGSQANSWGSPPTAPPTLDPLNYGFNRYAFDYSDPSNTNTRL